MWAEPALRRDVWCKRHRVLPTWRMVTGLGGRFIVYMLVDAFNKSIHPLSMVVVGVEALWASSLDQTTLDLSVLVIGGPGGELGGQAQLVAHEQPARHTGAARAERDGAGRQQRGGELQPGGGRHSRGGDPGDPGGGYHFGRE
eukprot:1187289-Prorocentrum_minimum.AAC.2